MNQSKKPRPSEICPVGSHVVRGHWRNCQSGTRTRVDTHYRNNRGKKSIKGFPGHHEIDPVIQYWLEYWTKMNVKFPKDLTPLHIKAIIAVESSFNPKARTNTSTATGLMQILKTALGPLKGKKRKNWREVRDHYINVSQKDLEDPVINIAVGTRWLAHKFYLLRNHKNITVRDVIRDYHSRDKEGEKYAEKVLGLYNSSK